jgi:hypothetical protein
MWLGRVSSAGAGVAARGRLLVNAAPRAPRQERVPLRVLQQDGVTATDAPLASPPIDRSDVPEVDGDRAVLVEYKAWSAHDVPS